MKLWTTEDSAELYNISGWSNGYFQINGNGHVEVTPLGSSGRKIDLKRVVDDLVRRGLSMPLLLRFPDILEQRLIELKNAFQKAIEAWDYKGRYQPVMPIKVNQHRPVLEELLQFGGKHGMGLEVGSKPELLIAVSQIQRKGGLIICNGYKDVAYIETALLSQRLGLTTLIIVDRFAELDMIIAASKRMGVRPKIGVRAKLSAKGSGRWAESGGDNSKFGLTVAELVAVVERLRAVDMLDCLVCLHFHIGSQITAIRSVKEALDEAVRIFVDLYRMGANLSYLDCGGGLAVDYDGSKTNFHASRNYTLEEYAADIIDEVAGTLQRENIPHPTIITESGRALVAHHSVLVFNVLGHHAATFRHPSAQDLLHPKEDDPKIIHDMWEVFSTISKKNYQEAYHDALKIKEDALSMFRHGIIDLTKRAKVEEMFWASADKIWKICRELDYVPDELEGLEKGLADIYFCNFSVFQSVPDSWAVDALFPIMPIHRLDEKPTRPGILADLTCDSDGKLDRFIDLHDVKNSLELHSFKEGDPYFLGVFLVGAYQEVLGDLHNLFGDVNAVHISYDEERDYVIRHVVTGDKVKDVLAYVMYDTSTIMTRLRNSIEEALQEGHMTFEESANLVRHFEAGLAGYTYLEQPEIAEALLSSVLPQASDSTSETKNEPAPTNV